MQTLSAEKPLKTKEKPPYFQQIRWLSVAEKEGFEPSRPFRGLHDFQSCALDQLGDFSIAVKHLRRMMNLCAAVKRQRYYYSRGTAKVKPYFGFFSKNEEAGERILFPRPCLTAFRKRCCPRRDLQRHPVCGYFCPPVFSWNPCRRAPSSPPRRRPSIRRSYRPKIRYSFSISVTPFPAWR